ncbi:MAG: tRNA nucleotidyltransferase/poly(A) polymerase family protein [Symbiobacteriia bacterium]
MPIRPQVLVPAPLAALLRRFAAAADARGLATALVGGAVRDLLLDREPLDLDISVAAEAPAVIELGQAIAGWFGTVVEAHDAFGTTSVKVPLDGREARLDLAMRRRERYLHPGALPDVSPGAWEDDLRRRDFTINALAWPLSGLGTPLHAAAPLNTAASAGDFEAPLPLAAADLLTAPHALDDLVQGRLRVLHSESFMDDPTRLFRGARFAARLDFGLEPGTERLATDAVRQGALASISPQRLAHEVCLTAAEPQAFAAFRLLSHLGVWRTLLHGWAEPAAAAVRAADGGLGEALVADPGGVDRAAAHLLTWLAAGIRTATDRRSAADAPAAWPRALGLQGRELSVLTAGLTRLPGLQASLQSLGPDAPPAAFDSWLAAEPREVQAALYALGGKGLRQALSRYWLALRQRPVLVAGRDLAALGWQPGPVYSEALGALRQLVLDGALEGRASQLAWLEQHGPNFAGR